jgi:hypothetical protein
LAAVVSSNRFCWYTCLGLWNRRLFAPSRSGTLWFEPPLPPPPFEDDIDLPLEP